jgi:hypothetical protein
MSVLKSRLETFLRDDLTVLTAVLVCTPRRSKRGGKNYEHLRGSLEYVHARLKALDESLDLKTKPKDGWPEDQVE